MEKICIFLVLLTWLSLASCQKGGGTNPPTSSTESYLPDDPLSENDAAEPVTSEEPLLLGLCSSQGLEVFESDANGSWAKTRCTLPSGNIPTTPEGFCENWEDCKTIQSDGLTYLTFVLPNENIGGIMRYNDDPGYSSVLVIHRGAGGVQWVEDQRDYPNDLTDWQSLQDDYGIRVVSIRWFNNGINYGFVAGRFSRSTPESTTLGQLSKRPATVIQWIFENLNPDDKPFGVTGTSGGADAVLGPFLTNNPVAQEIDYLGLVSYAPFNNIVAGCNADTPPGTFVDPNSGALGNSGAAAGIGYGQTFFDELLQTTACSTATMTFEISEGSNAEGILDELINNGGNNFTAKLHATVATGPPSNDNLIGVTWALGNLVSHPFFIPETFDWNNCSTQGHGTPLTRPDLPCFDRIYFAVIDAFGLQ